MDRELIDKIKALKEKGYNRSNIISELKAEGYSIEEALKGFKKVDKITPKKLSKKIANFFSTAYPFVIIIVLVVSSIAGFYLYQKSMGQYDTIEIEGNSYYLDRERIFISDDLEIEINMSSRLKNVYEQKGHSLAPEFQEVLESGSRLQERHYEIIFNATKEDIFIDLINQKIDAETERGITLVNGEDASLHYALKLVQNIRRDITKPLLGGDYIRYPYETLFDRRGDEVEKALLLYKLLERQGYGLAFVKIPNIEHIIVGINCPRELAQVENYCLVNQDRREHVGDVDHRVGFYTKRDLHEWEYTIYAQTDGKKFTNSLY